MDPITRASKQFLTEAEAFWRSGESSVMPMVAELSDRGELIKVLRLQELAPDNRRPLFLYEAPFADEASYFDGLAEVVANDYERLRKGIQEEGVSIPPLDTEACAQAEPGGPLARAVRIAARAALLLGERFEGALVALIPSRIEDCRGWPKSMATVRRVRLSPRTRFGVFDPPTGPLAHVRGSAAAHLRIDPDELRAYLRRLGDSNSKGPPLAGAPTQAPGEEKAALETIEQRSPSSDVARRLKALLLDGAEQGAAGHPVLATNRARGALVPRRGGGRAAGRDRSARRGVSAPGGNLLAPGGVRGACDPRVARRTPPRRVASRE